MSVLGGKVRFTISVALAIVLCACDSVDTAAKKILADQGLTLLQPARDYIALGGIVTLSGGKFQYEDPYDTLPNDNGTYSVFNAVVSQSTRNQSIGIDAALGSLSNLVTLPVAISGAVNHSSSVKLAQIDTGGTRYTTQKVTAILAKQATNDAVKADLQAGVRTFVIQEVYTATSFSITSSNSTSIAAAAGGSAPKPQCSNANSADSSVAKGSTGGSALSGSTQSGSSNTNSESPGNSSPPGGTSGAASPGAPSSSSSGSDASGSKTTGSGSAPLSLGFCWGGNSSLSFKTEQPIPFAVRLNEVEVGPGGVIQVKKKNFHLPLNTLGGDNVANSVLPPSGVVLNLDRKPRS